MSLILSGTDGLSDVDGSAATPAIRGTDANTGIFFPAADTIAFAEGGAEVARFNSSGNFGLGTTAPSSRLTTSGATGTGNGLTIIDIDYSNDTHQIYGNNSLHLSAGTGGAGAILFRTGGSERARFNSTGALVLAGGTTTANGIGITFPATQSASTDANTLDDYEEGTWTPVLGTSNGGTATMSVQEGWYVKIGKFVQFSAQVVWTAKNTWDFNTRISGLPFAARSNTTNYGWPNACQMESNLTTTPFVYSIEANTTQGYVNQIYSLGQLGQSDFPTSGRVLINGCYQVA